MASLSLARATAQATGAVARRRWALFGVHQTESARAWAGSGHFAFQVAPSGDEGWLMANTRRDLIYAAGCVGASPAVMKHPVDGRGCARLSRHNLLAAHRVALIDESSTDLTHVPRWRAFPWNQRTEAVAWATKDLALLTEDDGTRWMMGPWSIVSQMPALLGIRRNATQQDLIGYLKLDREEIWREAFALCSRDCQKIASLIPRNDASVMVGVTGIATHEGLGDGRKLWDRLCLQMASMLEQLRPGHVYLGLHPWTDAAMLWALQQEGWSREIHVCLSVPWDMDGCCFGVGDPDEYIGRIRQQPTFRGGNDAEAFARRIFVARDEGAKLNQRHRDFEALVGFDCLRAASELMDRVVSRDVSPRPSYSEHDGRYRQQEEIALRCNRLLVTCKTKDHISKLATHAMQMCTGQRVILPAVDVAAFQMVIPP